MTLYIPLQMSAIFKLFHFYAQVAVAAILSLISGNGRVLLELFPLGITQQGLQQRLKNRFGWTVDQNHRLTTNQSQQLH